jgi:hypothetical protein
MNVAVDVARDHSRIASDCETVVVIPGDMLGFSHDDWSIMVACALRSWGSSCNNRLRGRRRETTRKALCWQ